ncbi:hypothetical protein K443DRAFT_673396 [Laccaria amethystina LaAM-08-1]|uniref:Unplaced genomic scaffold K443scaffold_12, whole genome shotgun sequence n=1 Tax=Laccaria amethystina LaAM-08-1 TaxID=1095629 RepID=A0A0C9Y0S7_9AGAR|nr:hypothetical protein K443DRAFT_673396 [Laccaria amethystina LaAM-08-1]
MHLPSILPSTPAVQDVTSTAQQVNNVQTYVNDVQFSAKVTTPEQTPIFICALKNCNRLFPSRDRVMMHRKRDHDSTDDTLIITWNE